MLPYGPQLYRRVQRENEESVSSAQTLPLLLILGIIIPVGLVYGLVTTNESQVMAMILGLLGLLIIAARPYWGLIFFIGLVYIRPEESFPALAGMRLTLVVSLITLCALWFQLFLNRERMAQTPTNGMIIGFGLVTIASSLTTGILVETATEISKLVILVILVLNLVRTPGQYRVLVNALIVFTTYLACYSIYLYFTGQALQGVHEGVERSKATGIFGDPNDLAATIIAGLALALSQLTFIGKAIRWFYVLISGIMLWAILLTNSRGGMLALLAVVGGFVLVFSHRKGLAIVLAILVSSSIFLLAPSRMTNFDSEEASANSRFVFWDNAISQLRSHPIMGVGYQQFADLNEGMVAHNSFVQCFAELGLSGYFFWIGCIYYCFRRRTTKDGIQESSNTAQRELLGARLALMGYLSACFWITRTFGPIMCMMFSLPIAQQLAYSKPPALFVLSAEERNRDWRNIVALCFGSILLIFIMARLNT
jgi:putative inorganic carbon (hco3(-)) transporter